MATQMTRKEAEVQLDEWIYSTPNKNLGNVDVLNISLWKWRKVKTAYRKYVSAKYGEKLTHFSSDDNISASSYLNHYNEKFNIPKFNKLRVEYPNGGVLSINFSTMQF